MNVIFYDIMKKPNSTKQPTNSDIKRTFNDVILKENCSILSPVLKMQIGVADNLSEYNYCRIPAFSRYYFIKDMVYVHSNILEVYCEVDVLGTYKDLIGEHRCYILRAATGYNYFLPDYKFPATGEIITRSTSPVDSHGSQLWANDTPWVTTYNAGTYVIGVLSKESSPGGSLSYYAMSNAQFEHFKTVFLGDTSWAVGSFAGFEISEELWKSLFNPIQYIATCRWFPVPLEQFTGTQSSSIKLGWWELPNCNCLKLTQLYLEIEPCEFPLPGRQVTGLPYEHMPPYADYKLYIPPFGEFPLNGYIVGKLYRGFVYGTIKAHIRVDIVSGKGALLVSYTPPNDVGTDSEISVLVWETAQIAVNVSFGQINNDIVGAVKSGIGMLESMASGIAHLDPGAIIGGVAGGLVDAVQAFMPSAQHKTGDGSIAIYQSLPFRLQCMFKEITEQDTDDFGGVVYMTDLISNYSGYILTQDAHIEILGATALEIDKIKTFMDGGFFYE